MAARSRVKPVMRMQQMQITRGKCKYGRAPYSVWYSGCTSGDNEWDTSKKSRATLPRP